MPKKTFSNILPHDLSKPTPANIEKRGEIFIEHLKAIYSIIQKISENYNVKALDYKKGIINVVEYSRK